MCENRLPLFIHEVYNGTENFKTEIREKRLIIFKKRFKNSTWGILNAAVIAHSWSVKIYYPYLEI